MIDTKELANSIEKQIRDAVIENLGTHVERIISELALDPDWIDRLESQINQHFSRRFSETLSMVDVDSLIVEHIDRGIDRWHERLKKNFTTIGICDQAESLELTVMPEAVVVENDLISKTLSVVKDAEIKQTLTVNNLVLRGSVNVDNHSWQELADSISAKTLESLTEQWKQQLTLDVLTHAKTQGIEFNSITLLGKPLVDGDTLNPRITSSKLTELGVLKNLEVSGEAHIHDTVHVNNNRLGINTDRPDMALSVWDEEVTMSIGKLSDKKAFVGTSRLQNLAIGVNRTAYLEINTEGLVTIKNLRIGKHRIGHGDQVPGYAGTKGDIVFNNDPKEHAPFAWVCLGEYRWQPLRSA